MPPDPVGIRPGPPAPVAAGDGPALAPDDPAPLDWYDRSSLPGDSMVMIAGQTEADWLRRAPDSFCEFIDGIVYMPPRVRPEHQFDLNLLLFLIQHYHALRPVGCIVTGPLALRLRDDCYLEPDLFLVPAAVRPQLREEGFARPPVLLVVEVLSPSNRDHDLETKARLYREARVEEIWFVDRPNRLVIVERRENDGYAAEPVAAGPVRSRSLPGFWFDPAWLWAEPPPNLLGCVEAILAGPPGG